MIEGKCKKKSYPYPKADDRNKKFIFIKKGNELHRVRNEIMRYLNFDSDDFSPLNEVQYADCRNNSL